MHQGNMSYAEYRTILACILKSGKYCDYTEASANRPFVVLRHDIEFSIGRAYKMHLIDTELGIRSSYFAQLTNNAYNVFSRENRDMLREMHANGQHIGLHYHWDPSDRLDTLATSIRRQADVMSGLLGFEIDRFSFHRPNNQVLANYFEVPGLLNTYHPMFFTYVENASAQSSVRVKYLADSMHRWKYGYPNLETLMEHSQVQVLMHPYSWTETGHNNLENFRSLVNEKQEELLETLDSECMHFAEVRNAL